MAAVAFQEHVANKSNKHFINFSNTRMSNKYICTRPTL